MSNEQRAAEAVARMDDNARRERAVAVWVDLDKTEDKLSVLLAALDAAEARGRADVEAKVRELADELDDTSAGCGFGDPRADAWHHAADRLRALVATGTDRDEER